MYTFDSCTIDGLTTEPLGPISEEINDKAINPIS